jgi:hypothetical protein
VAASFGPLLQSVGPISRLSGRTVVSLSGAVLHRSGRWVQRTAQSPTLRVAQWAAAHSIR